MSLKSDKWRASNVPSTLPIIDSVLSIQHRKFVAIPCAYGLGHPLKFFLFDVISGCWSVHSFTESSLPLARNRVVYLRLLGIIDGQLQFSLKPSGPPRAYHVEICQDTLEVRSCKAVCVQSTEPWYRFNVSNCNVKSCVDDTTFTVTTQLAAPLSHEEWVMTTTQRQNASTITSTLHFKEQITQFFLMSASKPRKSVIFMGYIRKCHNGSTTTGNIVIGEIEVMSLSFSSHSTIFIVASCLCQRGQQDLSYTALSRTVSGQPHPAASVLLCCGQFVVIFGSNEQFGIAVCDLERRQIRESTLERPQGVVKHITTVDLLGKAKCDLLASGWCRWVSGRFKVDLLAVSLVAMIAAYVIREELYVLHEVREQIRMKRVNVDRIFEYRKRPKAGLKAMWMEGIYPSPQKPI